MQFGFAIGLNQSLGVSSPAKVQLLSGASLPDSPQKTPFNLIPQPAGEFDSAAGWSQHSGLTIDTAQSAARWDGSQTATQQLSIALSRAMEIGKRYGFLSALKSITSGAVFLGAGVPGGLNTSGSGITETRHYARDLTASAAFLNGRMAVGAGAVLEIDYLRVYDLTALLQKKWRIVFVYSQSNWVGTEDAPDRLQNDPPEPRAVVVPSLANNIRGSFLDSNGVGIPMLLVDPVVHMTISAGGPAGAFARTFCNGLRDDEILVYVATGYSGGGRIAPDGVWNRQNNGIAWANMLKQVNGTIANAPEGSSVVGMLFCQGEADLSANSGDTHTLLIRDDIQYLRSQFGNFPVVINEIGWAFETNRVGLANMIESQAKLDSSSGDALSLPLCKYLHRPSDATFIADNLHYDQRTQRKRGSMAAQALLEMLY